jgi:hypothetical protein
MFSDFKDIPLLLLTPSSCDKDRELKLPCIEDNIFARIIRNPDNPDRPKETQCTELLCGILRNVPTFQMLFIQLLAQAAGIQNGAALDWSFRTEHGISGKRLDLLLKATNQGGGTTQCLWPVEIKVGAGFHYSRCVVLETAEEEGMDETEVNQLINYDRWLSTQQAGNTTGFVLAKHDMTSELPRLTNHWHCLTWGQLARRTKKALQAETFSASEAPFIRHFLGFMNCYLRDIVMDRLDFNGIAYLKAYRVFGNECQEFINDIVSSIVPLLQSSSLGKTEVGFEDQFDNNLKRSIAWADLGLPVADACLITGWEGEWQVLVETNSRFDKKHLLRETLTKAFQDHQTQLVWRVEDDPERWPDAVAIMPTTELLHVPDQKQAVHEFVQKGIADLEKINIKAIIDGLK